MSSYFGFLRRVCIVLDEYVRTEATKRFPDTAIPYDLHRKSSEALAKLSTVCNGPNLEAMYST